MFLSALQPAKAKLVPHNEGNLFSVLAGDELLAGPEVQQLLAKIKTLIALPLPYYNELYQKLLEKFAEFTQVLPGQHGQVGGLLLESLKQACLALEIYQQQTVGELDPLFIYALFSAALLMNAPRVFNKTIMICDNKGVCLSTWSPSTGTLGKVGDYYKVRNYGFPTHQISTKLRILLSKYFISRAALAWLAEDWNIFVMWLSTLGADEEGSGELGLTLSRMRIASESEAPGQKYLPPTLKMTQPKETVAGENFLAWLKEESRYRLNPAYVRVFGDGVVLSEQVFQDFSKRSQYSNWRSVADQVKKLGCTTEFREQEEAEKSTERKNPKMQSQTAKKTAQKFFTKAKEDNSRQQELDERAFRDCLVISEKNFLRFLSKKLTNEEQWLASENKKLASKRIAKLKRLLGLAKQRKTKKAVALSALRRGSALRTNN